MENVDASKKKSTSVEEKTKKLVYIGIVLLTVILLCGGFLFLRGFFHSDADDSTSGNENGQVVEKDRELKYEENYTRKEDGSLENISEEIKKEQTAQDVRVSGLTITKKSDDSLTKIHFVVTNLKSENYGSFDIVLVLFFQDGTSKEYPCIVDDTIEPNGTHVIDFEDNTNILDAYTYKFRVRDKKGRG